MFAPLLQILIQVNTWDTNVRCPFRWIRTTQALGTRSSLLQNSTTSDRWKHANDLRGVLKQCLLICRTVGASIVLRFPWFGYPRWRRLRRGCDLPNLVPRAFPRQEKGKRENRALTGNYLHTKSVSFGFASGFSDKASRIRMTNSALKTKPVFSMDIIYQSVFIQVSSFHCQLSSNTLSGLI